MVINNADASQKLCCVFSKFCEGNKCMGWREYVVRSFQPHIDASTELPLGWENDKENPGCIVNRQYGYCGRAGNIEEDKMEFHE